MNAIEQYIWAAAFANIFEKERQLSLLRGEPDSLSGFTCAEIADTAVEKYREALKHPDAEYLLVVKDKKVGKKDQV